MEIILLNGEMILFQVDEIEALFTLNESWDVDFQFQDQYLGRFRFNEFTN